MLEFRIVKRQRPLICIGMGFPNFDRFLEARLRFLEVFPVALEQTKVVVGPGVRRVHTYGDAIALLGHREIALLLVQQAEVRVRLRNFY